MAAVSMAGRVGLAAVLCASALTACEETTQSGPTTIAVDGGAKDTGGGTDSGTTVDVAASDAGPGSVDTGSADVAVPAGTQLIALAGNARHFALGSAQVYWTTKASQQVLRTGHQGGLVHEVAKEVGINEPGDIVLANGAAFWAATNPTLYFVRRYEEATGAKATVLTTKPQIAPQVIRDLAADETHVYFTTGSNPEPNHTGLIRRVEVGEGTAVTLRSWQKFPTGIALHGEHVYWTTLAGPAVQRCLKNGSDAEKIAKDTTGAVALTVDGTFVWWANQAGLSVDVKEGTIMRAAIQGGSAQVVANKQRSPVAMASGTNHVWWVNAGSEAGGWKDGQLVRFERSGSSDPEVVRDDLERPVDLAIGAGAAFWLVRGANDDATAAIFRLDLSKL